ncbi:MAG: cytochrome-c peroxidase [Bacteroidia bacterium]
MPFHSSKINKFLVIGLVVFSSCKKEDKNTSETINVELTPYEVTYPDYFPVMTIPEDNPLTAEGINLGRKLYYDPILSSTGYSCSSCHNNSESFSSYSANSLPHVNLAWNTYFLWKGKISGALEDIMMFEVEEFFQTDISKLNQSEDYQKEFKKVYNVDVISSKEVAYALAQFFRTLTSSNSKFDQYLKKELALTPSEMNGFQLFFTEKGDCFHCHSLGLFTDNSFHNIGLDSVFNGMNWGRYDVSGNKSDIGLYKTPTLRNVELTPPYMHDGRFETLEEVVEHYNSGVLPSATLDPIMTKAGKENGLMLSPTEKKDLVAFLKTLTDQTFINNPQLSKP